ncbi:MAG: hypothetical protein KGQ60_09575, partial [Planctomycetes bacterium]|nr:hypothetical protein [Planctomycetota bacterium]
SFCFLGVITNRVRSGCIGWASGLNEQSQHYHRSIDEYAPALWAEVPPIIALPRGEKDYPICRDRTPGSMYAPVDISSPLA